MPADKVTEEAHRLTGILTTMGSERLVTEHTSGFYTPAKSDFTLLGDPMSFILIFRVRIGIGHVSGF